MVVYEKQELFTLDVTISKPQPGVKWYFKNKEVKQNSKYKINCTNMEKTEFQLVVHNVELMDTGVYSCKIGKNSTQGIVTVKGNYKCFSMSMITKSIPCTPQCTYGFDAC